MKSPNRLVQIIVLTLPIFFLPGCGGSDGPERHAVTGEITLQGKPLENGTIQFDPQGEPKIPGGAVIENGRYAIPAEKGLPAGRYVVRISASDEQGQAMEGPPGESRVVAEELIPKEYNTESTQTVEITAGGENELNFSIP